jgi:hypothetical protein
MSVHTNEGGYRHLCYHTNIRIGIRCSTVRNTLAYYAGEVLREATKI